MLITNRIFFFFLGFFSVLPVCWAKGLDVQLFNPTPSPHGFFTVQGGELSSHMQYSAGVGFVYGKDLLQLSVLESDGTQTDVGALVQHRADAVWMASLGLWNWVELGVALPVVWQAGKERSAFSNVGVELGSQALRVWGVGDVRISPKVKLLNIRNGVFAMAFTPQVIAPSGGGAAYASSSGWGAAPVLNMSTRVSRVRAGLDIGYRVRDKSRVATFVVDDEIFWKAAVSYNVARNPERPLEIVGELFGQTAALDPFALKKKGAEKDLASALTTLEAGVGVRWWMFEHVLLSGGVGAGVVPGYGAPLPRVHLGASYFSGTGALKDGDNDGVIDGVDECPDRKEDKDGFKDGDGCPEPDNDEDHLADEDDQCPMQAEDKDGFEDEDGCPDLDNDKDGIPDLKDACMMQAEDKDGVKDEDGCPDIDNDGDGVWEGSDACEGQPEDKDGFEDEDGCPDPDNDGDGLEDMADACPDYAEDKDGIKDGDGCPEESDDDGIADEADACPKQSETFNGVKDKDGCPESTPASTVVLQGDDVKLSGPVSFTKGTAQLNPKAQAVLEHLVAMMKVRTDIALLRILAYSDPSASKQQARALAKARQKTVLQYMVSRGISSERLDASEASDAVVYSAKWRFYMGFVVVKKNPVGIDVKTQHKTQKPPVVVPAENKAEEGGIEFGF